MGQFVALTASDGHELSAYVAPTQGKPIGAIVVIQEIFGVNASIREVADAYAAEGFVAVAPALFDRFGKGIELGYDDAGMQRACAVAYYPGGIGKVAAEEPSCPVIVHVGTDDSHVAADQLDAVRAAHPDVVIYAYDGADHAFANSQRPSYKADSAVLAWQRSLEFLKANISESA